MQPISVLEAGNATLAQLVEQRIRNAQVEGSNPLSGSLTALDLWILGGFCLWVFFLGGCGFGHDYQLLYLLRNSLANRKASREEEIAKYGKQADNVLRFRNKFT